jgi:uncharacterized protein YyaL (SSP411 family)
MPNRLANEPSPYLQQHKNNPVDWWPWSAEALEEARRQDKPLLVSIGYSSCHWCHVMAHESFEHPDIAALMNEHFVNIKVDREERPDVDAVFMTAVQAMTGHGGWPLNAFATPDGVPFFGGTYWPPADARGMPGFPRVLESIARAWEHDRANLIENADRVSTYLQDTTRARPGADVVSPDLGAAALERLGASFDATWGGFGGAPKFPQASTLEFLVRHLQRTGSTAARTMLTTTLDRMAAGGIYDQIGGGFARYAVDAEWAVPHFEKMLYDNAQLMRAYLDAWASTGRARYAQVALDTGEWLLEEMLLPDGGFASALDADSEGVEGRFYVWSDAEIADILPPDQAAVVRQRFGITPGGNFEGNTVLTLSATIDEIADTTGQPAEHVVELLETGVTILRDHRRQRVRPGRDDKVVTGWNGLAISALARAGAVLHVPGFIDAARRAAGFLLDNVRNPDGSLWRTWTNGERRGNGVLEDYVCLAEGLIHLHRADGDIRWLDEADRLVQFALRDFGREGGPDFFDTPASGTGLAVRPNSLQDNATPSGNSVAADVLLTLGTLTDRRELVERAEALVASLSDVMVEHPGAFGRYLAVAERLVAPIYTLVIGGDRATAGHRRLTTAALSYPSPALVIAHAAPGMDEDHLQRYPVLQDRTGRDGASAAWLCREGACMLPAVSVADLGERLSEMEAELSASTTG